MLHQTSFFVHLVIFIEIYQKDLKINGVREKPDEVKKS